MGRLKELRRRRGLTQEGLANVLGTSQQTISRIEN
ncbi:MAG: helix-turn-helix domain-containing protein, partial [Lachnospiraceae bacterium]|nr:helix-turn-helix domain-containing protein [Lachnospiraceae bacterium]